VKFHQAIAPVILCIMYIAPIFGAERAIVPFRRSSRVSYKQTAHIKPYPSFLRKFISSSLEAAFGDYGGPQKGYFEKIKLSDVSPNLSLASAIIYTLWIRWLGYKIRKAATFKEGFAMLSVKEAGISAGIAIIFPSLILAGLFEAIINKISKSYMYIEFKPRIVIMDKLTFCITGSRPISYPNIWMPFYRTECRFLTNAKFSKRVLTGQKVIVSSTPLFPQAFKSIGNVYFFLNEGKVTVYSRTISTDMFSEI